MGADIGALARRILAIRLQEGLVREGSAHGAFVAVFFEHTLPKNPSEQARDTRFFSSRFHACPSGNPFIECDGDLPEFGFHTTNMACHELSVNSILATPVALRTMPDVTSHADLN